MPSTMNESNPLNTKGLLLLSGLMGFLILANYQQLVALLYEVGTFVLINSGARKQHLETT